MKCRQNIAYHLFRNEMAPSELRSNLMIVLSVVLVLGGLYLIDPTFFGLLPSSGFENFEDAATLAANSNGMQMAPSDVKGQKQAVATTGNPHVVTPFQDMCGNMMAAPSMAGPSMAGPPMSAPSMAAPSMPAAPMKTEGFDNMNDVAGPASLDSAHGPAGCYPRDQLTPSELLPKDPNSVWAQQNPMGTGSLKGKNFLSAGALIGVNTVGQTLRNANYQLRSEPPNPQVPVTVFNNSTIEPDTNRRDLEID